MLTKDALSSGLYLKSFESFEGLLWSEARILQSLDETLSARTGNGDIWLFAYGSLIWNPLLDFIERAVATLHGWQRSFCLRMVAGRGTEAAPGRMLAVEPGGHTQGVAYRLGGEVLHHDLQCVWRREMVFGSYRPVWERITLADGNQTEALVFVADPAFSLYEADSSVVAIARQIALASGPHGSNAEYLQLLQQALREHGLSDHYIDALATTVACHLRDAALDAPP
ncbi:gamma-glutamylcyclotransferase [Metapseudomonas resinovorans]|uniref:glutathione-specific gamma-glutamylcyclotransferase n=1 Tax=Metapseudomonas resinovorans NBRC 106553 TaxID=1245471 RepID=S6AEC4_METRE|nr:gamma-glutamylcyclotransferase [Pseudomonas resinovorans]BAN47952.1 hypothetical protein PCA10_22200 [Pseudomonas resinovorans NBRC 106553]